MESHEADVNRQKQTGLNQRLFCPTAEVLARNAVEKKYVALLQPMMKPVTIADDMMMMAMTTTTIMMITMMMMDVDYDDWTMVTMAVMMSRSQLLLMLLIDRLA